MATYRAIYMNFWSDTKIVDDFTPEDKYFMLYCLTNNFTNLCGCYEISIKQMSRDTGYNEETILRLIDRLENTHKVISYNKENKELLIKNWHKYNWTKSQKLDKPLGKEIENVKTIEFKRFLVENYNKRDTVSIPYAYPMHTTVSVTVTDTDNNINNIDNNKYISEIVKTYEDNIGMITPATMEILTSYLDEMEKDLIIEAIKKASISNKRSCKYIQGILNNWKRKGIKTKLDIEKEEEEFKGNKTKKNETTKEEAERLKREWGLEDDN